MRALKRSGQAVVLVALLISAAIVVGGCGSKGNSGNEKRLTKAEFAARANAICVDAQKKTDALGEPKTTAEFLALLPKYRDLSAKTANDLKKLKPPANEQTLVDKVLTASGQQIGVLDQMITALEKNDKALVQKLAEKGSTMDTANNRTFRQLGATSCAKS